MILLFALIIEGVALYVLYLIIKTAIDHSRMAEDMKEIKSILKEFKEQRQQDEKINLEELEQRVFNQCLRCHRTIKPEDKVCPSCGFELK